MMSEIKSDYYKVGTKNDIVISSSSLSSIDPEVGGSPQKFLSFFDQDKERKYSLSLDRGNLVHLYCENPSNFIISNIDKPSEAISYIIEGLHAIGLLVGDMSEDIFNRTILKLAAEINYGQSWKPDTVIQKVWKEGKEYVDFLDSAEGKIIMSKSTKEVVDKCIQSLNGNSVAKSLLFEEDEFGNMSYFNELEVYDTTPNGTKFKGKIDRLVVDFENNVIKMPDIKTTGKGAYNFQNSFEHYRYYRQLAFYKRLANKYLQEKFPSVNFFLFTWEFYNVVVETIAPFNTVVYKIPEVWILKGAAEINKLVARINWHIVNGWDGSLEEKEQGGFINMPAPKE